MFLPGNVSDYMLPLHFLRQEGPNRIRRAHLPRRADVRSKRTMHGADRFPAINARDGESTYMRIAENGGWMGPFSPSLFNSRMMIFQLLSVSMPATTNERSAAGLLPGMSVIDAQPIAGLFGVL